jgi:hypothetical protein
VTSRPTGIAPTSAVRLSSDPTRTSSAHESAASRAGVPLVVQRTSSSASPGSSAKQGSCPDRSPQFATQPRSPASRRPGPARGAARLQLLAVAATARLAVAPRAVGELPLGSVGVLVLATPGVRAQVRPSRRLHGLPGVAHRPLTLMPRARKTAKASATRPRFSPKPTLPHQCRARAAAAAAALCESPRLVGAVGVVLGSAHVVVGSGNCRLARFAFLADLRRG